LCRIAPGLGSSARRIEGCISRYAAFNATEADGPKTKQDGAIIFFRGPFSPANPFHGATPKDDASRLLIISKFISKFYAAS
jgi:hypothetical protein